MQLSNSGGVVVVDDTYDEAKPLLEALGVMCVPYNYYDGDLDKLPEKPRGGIRFVFLDIELKGMKGQSDKNIASGLAGRLVRIISADNGPYVIIFWTKHQEIIDLVLQNCTKLEISPIGYVDLEKSECLGADGGYDVCQIITKISAKLDDIGAFELYTSWENVVSRATSKFISEFSGLVATNEDWSKNTSALFYKLYKAYVEKNEQSNHGDRFRYACHFMNRGFCDVLETMTIDEMSLPSSMKIENGDVSDEIIAKLNASLFLGENISTDPTVGCVIPESNEDMLTALVSILFKKGAVPENAELCKIVITPECDIAQNKTLKITVSENQHALHRVVYGVLYPVVSDDDGRPMLHKKTDSNYKIGPIWHKDGIHVLVCHFSGMTMQSAADMENGALFTLKRDVLFDLQSKASNHVNRLGAQFLK